MDGDCATIRLKWRRTPHAGEYARDLPNAYVHELIQQFPKIGHRARVWQWFLDDKLVQRTIIAETRVSTDWR